MAKVTINGEVFGFDGSRRPMSEALAIEAGLKIPYAKWEEDFAAGSARALCGFIWMVWHRDGRDVSLEDILSGAVEVDLIALEIEKDEGDADPTSLPPDHSPPTAGSTPASSPRSSASGHGKSRSSTSASSRH